jgi:hypothetical protein
MAVRFMIEEPKPKAAKPWWTSKTFRANAIILLIALVPPVQDFLRSIPGGASIADNLDQVTVYANLALRLFTGGPIGGKVGAASYGLGLGVKRLVNTIPGVNLK